MVVRVVSNCINHTGYISKAGYGLTYNPETKKTISAHSLILALVENVVHHVEKQMCMMWKTK